MKVYLGDNENVEIGWNRCSDITQLRQAVLDAEANEIRCDYFLSRYNFADLPKVLNFILSKIRLGGKLSITDIDAGLVARQIFREDQQIQDVNLQVFSKSNSLKCLMKLEHIRGLIPSNFNVENVYYGPDTFTITAKRLK